MTIVQFLIYAVISAPCMALAVVCFIGASGARNHLGLSGDWVDFNFLIGFLTLGFLLLGAAAGIWWFQP